MLGAARLAWATHLLGGEMTYHYLDDQGLADAPQRYEITVKVYNNCGSLGITAPRASASVGIYDQAFGSGGPLRSVAAPTVTTTYTLSAGAGYCAASGPVTVTVMPRLRIRNALSPNGGGRDDTWQIEHIGEYTGNHVLVFNH